jgi:hypothetical protein
LQLADDFVDVAGRWWRRRRENCLQVVFLVGGDEIENTSFVTGIFVLYQ